MGPPARWTQMEAPVKPANDEGTAGSQAWPQVRPKAMRIGRPASGLLTES